MICMHIYIHVCMHTVSLSLRVRAYMHTSYVHTYILRYIDRCMYIYICLYIYTYFDTYCIFTGSIYSSNVFPIHPRVPPVWHRLLCRTSCRQNKRDASKLMRTLSKNHHTYGWWKCWWWWFAVSSLELGNIP